MGHAWTGAYPVSTTHSLSFPTEIITAATSPLSLSLSLSLSLFLCIGVRLTRRSVTVALLSASCEQTPGTGGQPPLSANPHVGPGVAMRNALIQLFANGATGFNVYTADGFVDCDLWLAFRDVPPSVGKSTQNISIRNDWN